MMNRTESQFGNRRDFLCRAGAGLGLLALETLLSEQSRAGRIATIDHQRPFAPRTPDFPAKAKSVIFLFLVGGPSQVDSFDHKPVLQKLNGQKTPDSIRKAVEATKFANVFHGCKEELMGSPFRFDRYGESGMWVSELFPNVAKRVDDLCFIHSLQAESNNHAPASYQLHTGDVRPGKASLGSWVTYGLGSENQDLPAYVGLFHAGPLGGAANYSNGFLPAAYQPTRFRDSNPPVLNLLSPDEFTKGQSDTFDLIRQLNRKHRETHGGVSELDARIASYELAYRMQSAAMETGDFSKETAATASAFGLDDSEPRAASFGRKCLMARRLVERGVRFVQVYDMPDKDGWDAHSNLTDNHVPRARWVDRPIAALLGDLKDRGLLDSTLVICASEFGRTPMMQGDHGRQHNAAGFTIWLAGGGTKPGVRVGATDDIGLMAIDRPTPFRDLHATILRLLGLDNELLSYEVNGRPERLTGVADGAKVIEEVIG